MPGRGVAAKSYDASRMISRSLLHAYAFVAPFAFALFWVAAAVVHVAFAVAVFRPASTRRVEGGSHVFVGPELWTLAALVSGPVAVVTYWLLHCSRLAGSEEPLAPPPA